MLDKRDVRILLICLICMINVTLANIRDGDVRKLAFLLGGTDDRSLGNPIDGPVWFGSGRHM